MMSFVMPKFDLKIFSIQLMSLDFDVALIVAVQFIALCNILCYL